MNSVSRTSLLCTLSAAVLGSVLPSLLCAQVALRAAAPVSAVSVTATSGVAARITEKVDDHKRTALAGHIRPFLGRATDEGEVESSTRTMPLMLIFSRTAAQQAALDGLSDALHNGSSPMFHQWLTPQQFGASFSPADSDIAQVRTWLESKGFKVLDIPPSKTFLSFTGTVGQLKSAFGVSIHKFTINGEKHAATVNDPQIPSALASVVGGIHGLDNFSPKPLLQTRGAVRIDTRTGKAAVLADIQPTAAAALAAGKNRIRGAAQPQFTDQEGLYQVGPQDFYTIYNENALLTASTPINGAGQTIAVIEETEVNPADVTSFRSVFGLPAYPSTPSATRGGVNYLYGSATGLKAYAACYTPETVAQNSTYGEEGEADLDLQWAGVVAPAATIDFVACGSTATDPAGSTLGALGIDHAAQYVVNYLQGSVVAASMSYGECEADMTSSSTSGVGYYNNQWQQFAVEGITPVISSGDGGSTQCYQDGNVANGGIPNTLPPSVNGLGSSAWNVSAGGTDFSDAYQTNNYTSAPATTWWSATNGPGLGSAISYVPEMTWGGYCSSNLFASFLQRNASTSFGTVYNPIAICNSNTSTANGYTAVVGGAGGVSTYNAIPTWQSVYGVGQNSVSSTFRNLPDVSLFAANGFWGHLLPFCESDYIACTAANYQVDEIGAGGTSFVAPQLAGFFALVAQKTGAAQGQADYTLYNLGSQQYGTAASASSSIATCSGSALAAGQTPPTSCIFHDISSDTPSLQGGSIASTIAEPCTATGVDCNATLNSTTYTYGLSVVPGTTVANGVLAYTTSPGYDDATGLGSFNIANLVNNWNTVTPKFASSTSLSANAASAGSTASIVFTATVSATGRGGNATTAGTVTFYNKSSLSIGTGNVVRSCSGSGTSVACPGVATLTTTGSVLNPGSSTYTATFSGDAANDAASSSASVSVVGPAGVQIVSPTLRSGATAYITAYFTYPNLAAPTGAVTMTVNGSSSNISGLSCANKQTGSAAARTSCVATYSGLGVTPGNYTLVVSQAADSTYPAASGTGFVTVTP